MIVLLLLLLVLCACFCFFLRSQIDFFASIFKNDSQQCVFIAADGGRVCRCPRVATTHFLLLDLIGGFVCKWPFSSVSSLFSRPYIIVENGQPRLLPRHLDELAKKLRTFDDFVRDGYDFLPVGHWHGCSWWIAEFSPIHNPILRLSRACVLLAASCALAQSGQLPIMSLSADI